ncbi:hypothetical protein [Vibrio sp. Hal054]|uniref:hypothetical protein n=1 Tax=Vibrio sp. Hal054 TaxID=3035158 RepID=UPI00301C2D0A
MNKLPIKTYNQLSQQCELINGHRAVCHSLASELSERLTNVLVEFLEENSSTLQDLEENIRLGHEAMVDMIAPAIEQTQEYIDARSERWRDSDKAVKVEDWLYDLGLFKDELERDSYFAFDVNVSLSDLKLEPLVLPKQSSD